MFITIFVSLPIFLPLYTILSKDPYSKGVIPLAAIQMARMAKDNKFEIVTSHRTFVFRADNEGKQKALNNKQFKISHTSNYRRQ